MTSWLWIVSILVVVLFGSVAHSKHIHQHEIMEAGPDPSTLSFSLGISEDEIKRMEEASYVPSDADMRNFGATGATADALKKAFIAINTKPVNSESNGIQKNALKGSLEDGIEKGELSPLERKMNIADPEFVSKSLKITNVKDNSGDINASIADMIAYDNDHTHYAIPKNSFLSKLSLVNLPSSDSFVPLESSDITETLENTKLYVRWNIPTATVGDIIAISRVVKDSKGIEIQPWDLITKRVTFDRYYDYICGDPNEVSQDPIPSQVCSGKGVAEVSIGLLDCGLYSVWYIPAVKKPYASNIDQKYVMNGGWYVKDSIRASQTVVIRAGVVAYGTDENSCKAPPPPPAPTPSPTPEPTLIPLPPTGIPIIEEPTESIVVATLPPSERKVEKPTEIIVTTIAPTDAPTSPPSLVLPPRMSSMVWSPFLKSQLSQCPTDRFGRVCSGAGECKSKTITLGQFCNGSPSGCVASSVTYVICDCNAGYFGLDCSKAWNTVVISDKSRSVVNSLIVQSMNYHVTRTKTCEAPLVSLLKSRNGKTAAPLNVHMCPTGSTNTCVTHPTMCPKLSSLSLCPKGQKLCGKYTSCVDEKVNCGDVTPILASCPESSHRCADGSCSFGACSSSLLTSSVASPCAYGMVRCADGVSCRSSLFECVREIKFNGCRNFMEMCPKHYWSGAIPLCMDISLSLCENFSQCSAGTVRCGLKRDWKNFSYSTWIKHQKSGTSFFSKSSTEIAPGSLVRSSSVIEGNRFFEAQCQSKCNHYLPQMDPIDTIVNVYPRYVNSFDIKAAYDEKTVVFRLETSNDALDSHVQYERKIPVMIRRVADSDKMFGAFKKFIENEAVISSIVNVTPQLDSQMDTSHYKLTMRINDEEAHQDATGAKCDILLLKLVVYSVENVMDDVAKVYSNCVRGAFSGCSCAFNLRHFSTFVVVDQEAFVLASSSATLLSSSIFISFVFTTLFFML